MTLLAVAIILAIVQIILWFSRENRRRMLLCTRQGHRRFLTELSEAGASDQDIYYATAADSMPKLPALLASLARPASPILAGYLATATLPSLRWIWAALMALIIGLLPIYDRHTIRTDRRKEGLPPLPPRNHEENIASWASCLITAGILTITLAFGYADPQSWPWNTAITTIIGTSAPLATITTTVVNAAIFLAGLWAAYGVSRLGGRISTMFSSPRFEEHADDTTLLYLRSFNDDHIGTYMPMADMYVNTALRTLLWPRISFEEQLSIIANTSNNSTTLITIGRPGERLPRAGAQRSYYDQDNWREGVRLTAFRSRGIILTLGATVSLKWEIEHLKRWRLLSKCLFVVPPCRDRDLPQRLELALDALDISQTERAQAARLPLRYLTAFRIAPDGTLHWEFSKSRDWSAYSIALAQLSTANIASEDISSDEHDGNMDDAAGMDNVGSPDHPFGDLESATNDFRTQTKKQLRQFMLAPPPVLTAISESAVASAALRSGNKPAAAAEYGRIIARRYATGNTDPNALAYLLWQRFQATDNGRFVDGDDFTTLVRTLDGILQSNDVSRLWIGPQQNMSANRAIYTLWGSMAKFFQRSQRKDWERDARRTQLQAAHRMEDWRCIGETETRLAELADDYRQAYSAATVAMDAARRIGDIRMEGTARVMVAHTMSYFSVPDADRRRKHDEAWHDEFDQAIDQLISAGEITTALDAVEQFIDDAMHTHDVDTALHAVRHGLRVAPESAADRRQRFHQYEQWLLNGARQDPAHGSQQNQPHDSHDSSDR